VSFQETGTVRKQCQAYFTLGFALRIQEEISRILVDVLRRAMSSVHDRLAECEQHNGGHLEDVMSGMMCYFFFVLCYVSRPLIHLFMQMLQYALPYKCNCITISNVFNFFLTLKNRPIRWQTLYNTTGWLLSKLDF